MGEINSPPFFKITIFIDMRNLIKRILKEQFGETITMKYYMFDWDDNIMFMPTKIYLKTEDDGEIGMGTESFAEYRKNFDPKTGKAFEPFEYEGEMIVGLSDNPFRDFKSGESEFIRDMKNAELGPAWEDVVEAVNSGSYLAIITARGHNPEVFKRAFYELITNNVEGISIEEFYKSIKDRNRKAGENTGSVEDELDDYLDNCLFFPVGYYYPNGGIKPEEIKLEAIRMFKSSVEELIGYLNDNLSLKGITEYKLKPVFGFSDDDLKNIEFAVKEIKGVNIYSTHGGKKEKVKDEEDELQIESRIRKLLYKFII